MTWTGPTPAGWPGRRCWSAAAPGSPWRCYSSTHIAGPRWSWAHRAARPRWVRRSSAAGCCRSRCSRCCCWPPWSARSSSPALTWGCATDAPGHPVRRGGAAVRAGRLRGAPPPQRDPAADGGRADAQRGEPDPGHRRGHRGQLHRPGVHLVRHRDRRRRGGRGAGDRAPALPAAAYHRGGRGPAGGAGAGPGAGGAPEPGDRRRGRRFGQRGGGGAMTAALLLPAVPFAAALAGFLLPLPARRAAAYLAVGGAAGALLLAVVLLAAFDQPYGGYAELVRFGELAVDLGVRIDRAALLVALAVGAVALAVQVYSVSYLGEDQRYVPYAAQVSLFTAGMLLVVVAGDLIVLLVGWEVMGICSYLLIAHDRRLPEAPGAAVKAFLVTRVGDVGFWLGVILLGVHAGSFRIAEVLAAVGAGALSGGVVTAA